MQFQVPQFIEVEDKIFGPLTFKQFIYVAGGAGTAYLMTRILPFFIAIPIALAIVGSAIALAFLQFNGRPFILSVENAFYFLIHPRLYLWNNEHKTKKIQKQKEGVQQGRSDVYIPRLSESKLHELAWSLDIKERIASGVSDQEDRSAREERIEAQRKVVPVRTMRGALMQE